MNSRGLVRFCFLMVLVLLASGQTPGGARPCRTALPTPLLSELWMKAKELITSLPDEGSRGFRFLPVYCTNLSVSHKGLAWSEVGHVIRLYQQTVFGSDVIGELLPVHFPELLDRLSETLRSCGPSQKHSKVIRKFQKIMNQIRRDLRPGSGEPRRRRGKKGVFKAVREFPFVLRWIEQLHHQAQASRLSD